MLQIEDLKIIVINGKIIAGCQVRKDKEPQKPAKNHILRDVNQSAKISNKTIGVLPRGPDAACLPNPQKLMNKKLVSNAIL